MNRLYLIDRALSKCSALDYCLEELEKSVHTINGRLRDEEARGNDHDAKLRSHESRSEYVLGELDDIYGLVQLRISDHDARLRRHEARIENLLIQFDTLVMQLNSVVPIS